MTLEEQLASLGVTTQRTVVHDHNGTTRFTRVQATHETVRAARALCYGLRVWPAERQDAFFIGGKNETSE